MPWPEWTYTRCREVVDDWQTAVGGFLPSGLGVFDHYGDTQRVGVAAVRKF